MSCRGILFTCRERAALSVLGRNLHTASNILKDATTVNQHFSKVKFAWQRFQATQTASTLKNWCHRFNNYMNTISILCAKQCNAIVAQRIRRGSQILNLYSRIYDKQTMKHVVESCGSHTRRKPLSLLLGAVLLACDQQQISEKDINSAVEELTSLRTGELPPKDQLEKRLGPEWEPVINREHLAAWRKPIPDSYLYEYKMYGTFSDIPARAFFNVQTDLEYRQQWDKLIIDLRVIDKDEKTGSEVIRWVTHFPYPMYSREYVFIRKYKVDYEKKVMVFMSQATEHPDCPIVDKYVRVHQYKSNMIIRPHNNFDDNGFDFVLTYYDNPQAAIPSPAVRWMAAKGVPDFVDKLHLAAKRLHEANQRDGEDTEDEDTIPM